jgi:pimeloyl-ACP methyl ester carboxylesterase
MSAAEREVYLAPLREPERGRASHLYYRTFLTRELPPLLSGKEGRARPQVPVQLLGGALDPVVRWAPGVDLVSGIGHFLPEDKPEAVLERALAFL